jgi:hypothetical protein
MQPVLAPCQCSTFYRSVGGGDDLTGSERNSNRQIIEGLNDATSGRDDALSSRRFTTASTKQVQTPSAMVHKPPVIETDITVTAPSQGRTGVVEDSMVEAKGTPRHVTELGKDSASSDKGLGTLSDSLSRNHQEVREILQQGQCGSKQNRLPQLMLDASVISVGQRRAVINIMNRAVGGSHVHG